MKTFIIIPARMDSTRFPGKPLAKTIDEVPMVQRIYDMAKKVKGLNYVAVATPDRIIADLPVLSVMTSVFPINGTERVAEAMEILKYQPEDLIVILQGDEPTLIPSDIEALIDLHIRDSLIKVSTLIGSTSFQDLKTRNVVKAVKDNFDNIMYLTRASVPYMSRENGTAADITRTRFKQIGCFAMRGALLKTFTKMRPTKLEKIESIEQLRLLENGFKIKSHLIGRTTIGVDLPSELKAANEILRRRQREASI